MRLRFYLVVYGVGGGGACDDKGRKEVSYDT